MSPALSGSSAIRRFKGNDAIEIRDGITFEFYTGLPHIRKCAIYNTNTQYAVFRYVCVLACNNGEYHIRKCAIYNTNTQYAVFRYVCV